MAKYSIEIKKSAVKEFNAIVKKDLKRILSKIRSLAFDPRPMGSVRLSGQERHRLGQGDYRILYSIEGDVCVVYVVKIAHRKDVFRQSLT